MKTFKSADEAYDYMLNVVKGLENQGIKVTVTQWYKNPHPKGEEAEAHQRNCIEKYNGEERVSYEKWSNICFEPATNEEAEAVYIAQISLGWLGIGFDSGGGGGCRDWQADWSFHYNPEIVCNNEAREQSLEWLQQMLDKHDPIKE